MTLQDLTTFTATDPNSKWTLTTTRCTATNLPRNNDSYVWKDFGVGYFGDLRHLLDTQLTNVTGSISADNLIMGIWSINAGKGSYQDQDLNSHQLYWAPLAVTTTYTLIIAKGGTVIDRSVALTLNTTYYLTITRSAAVFSVIICSDDNRTVIVDTITGNGSTTSQRYLEVGFSRDATTSYSGSGYCENLNILSKKTFGDGLFWSSQWI